MTRTESFAGFARGVSPAVGRISGHVDGVEVEYKGGGVSSRKLYSNLRKMF